jgi:hypothetical protein
VPPREANMVFRVRIGVSGNRTVRDDGDVAAAVADCLRQVLEMYPCTDATPVVFTVLTALDEGAEEVVREALDMLANSTIELQRVLPATAARLEDLHLGPRDDPSKLLRAATPSIEPDGDPSPRGGERTIAHQRAARSIVDRADVMIVIRDEHRARGEDGTADVVGYADERGVPVLVVPTSRVGDSAGAPAAGRGAITRGSRFLASKTAFRRLDECNRVSIREGRAHHALNSQRARLGEPLERCSSYRQYLLIAGWALPALVRADACAIRYQSRYMRFGRAIHLLAVAAVAAVAFQVAFFPDRPILLCAEIAAVSGLIVVVWLARRLSLNERWIAYRSLAEAFRSALFIALSSPQDRAGRRDPVTELGNLDEPWFQRVFSEAWRERPEVELGPTHAGYLRSFLMNSWIDHQIQYHRETARRSRRYHSRYTQLVYVAAVLTVIVAITHMWIGRGAAFEFLAITLPAVGGALVGLRQLGQYRLHEERSNRIVERLARLKLEPASPGDEDASSVLSSVRRLAVDTQRVIAEENVDWSGVIEFHDLELIL